MRALYYVRCVVYQVHEYKCSSSCVIKAFAFPHLCAHTNTCHRILYIPRRNASTVKWHSVVYKDIFHVCCCCFSIISVLFDFSYQRRGQLCAFVCICALLYTFILAHSLFDGKRSYAFGSMMSFSQFSGACSNIWLKEVVFHYNPWE